MKSFITIFTLCALLIFLLNSCNQAKSTPLNPNGDSELALLMRQMADETEEMKKYVDTGRIPLMKLSHSGILSATATEPDKIAIPEYKNFAKSYLNTLDALKDSNKTNIKENYNNMVGMCMTCHRSVCPGPMVRIEKMYTPE